MIAHFKDFFLGLLIGLSLTVFFIGSLLVENFPFSQQVRFGGSQMVPLYDDVRMETLTPANENTANFGAKTYQPYNDLEDDMIAQELRQAVRVLAWVKTAADSLDSLDSLDSRALAIKQTWGKRCDVMIYFSTVEDLEFPAVKLGAPGGAEVGTTMAAFQYVHEHHLNQADWFMKADDSTYVVMENLRFFLADKNKSEAVYFGHLFSRRVEQGYYSGGGYVISQEALRRFGQNGFNSTICSEDGDGEKDGDVQFGLCMERLKVKTSRSLDEMGRSVFHPLHPRLHVLNRLPAWMFRESPGTARQGFGVSKYAATFHDLSPDEMRMMDFYMYHMRPYGIHSILRNNSSTNGQWPTFP
ncbi:glycoprotein-N-acetylgalactosamine 3-beta-galactosyltransferase 1-B-like isoform X2 [Physella acuta]|uniref:glycoprotein-N-acetylgalactosamine 3-beta-galactosyltransferase 1-B-like isoform X2 n=1 Tax=Physella acuta TaxID=109671 RepID=UPI0027DB00FC|nr:glycoprotein-N-acetylgalactosamine 3-beta-galactosyltransferase 1-B-like isoform X2 [Physella acuta]